MNNYYLFATILLACIVTNSNIVFQSLYIHQYTQEEEDKSNTTVLLELKDGNCTATAYCYEFCRNFLATCGECLHNYNDGDYQYFCACHYCAPNITCGSCKRISMKF